MPDLVPLSEMLPETFASARQPYAFDREAQGVFLRALALTGNVRAAAKRAGASRATVYRARQACPHFETLWDAALVRARAEVEAVLADRAINGVEEQVFYHGEEVAVRRRYDARLLLAHLGRLDRLARERRTREAADGFDFLLEDLLDLPEIERRGVDGATGEGHAGE